LVVYEPPVSFPPEDQIAADFTERIDALVAQRDFEGAVTTFFREGPRVSEAELERLRSAPYWSRFIVEIGHTSAYDARVQRSFVFDGAALARASPSRR